MDNKLTGFLVFLGVTGILFLGSFSLSFTDVDSIPHFDDCDLDEMYNIESCNQGDEIVDNIGSGWGSDFSKENGGFWVGIDDTEENGESQHPAVLWLRDNGFQTNEQARVDDLEISDMRFDSVVQNSLEQASSCRLTADVASHGEFTVETTEESQQYNDEPDFDERQAGELMQSPVTVESTKIRVTEDNVFCKFDMAEIIDEGMELDGEFVSWSGRNPVIGDEIGSSGDIQMDFSVDSDGDGFLESVDNCPETSGTIKGCKDSDGDGVADPNDVAPDTPGSGVDGSPTLKERIVQIFFDGWMEGEPLF